MQKAFPFHDVITYRARVGPSIDRVNPIKYAHSFVLSRFGLITLELLANPYHRFTPHYIDVIMTTIASQITSLTVVYSTVYSDVDQRKYQSSASLAFVWGIHRDRWIPRTKGQLRGKCFHLMASSWNTQDVLTEIWKIAPKDMGKTRHRNATTHESLAYLLGCTVQKSTPGHIPEFGNQHGILVLSFEVRVYLIISALLNACQLI